MQRILLGGLTLALCLSVANSHANDLAVPTEPLQQPALHSPLAQRSLMLDVTRAGDALVAVGERGFILRSEDKGQSWQQMEAPVSVTLTRVTFATAEQGWAVGHAGVVLHTRDGGRNWTLQLDGRKAAQRVQEAAQKHLQSEPGTVSEQRLAEARNLISDGPDKPFLAVHFFDEKRGIVVGAYGLAFATADGGATWQPINERLENPDAMHLYDIQASGDKLFIAGEQGLLLRSDDGGASFQALQSPASGTLFGLVTSSQGDLLAFGLRGKSYLSSDAGESWQAIANPQPLTLTAGTRLSDGSVLLVDESGRLLSSKNPQQGFAATTLDEPTYLTGLVEVPGSGIVMTGARGTSRLNLDALNRSEPREQ